MYSLILIMQSTPRCLEKICGLRKNIIWRMSDKFMSDKEELRFTEEDSCV